MGEILEFLKTDTFLIVVGCSIIFLFICFFISIIHLSKINRRYKKFIKKLGNGNNIEEDLNKYMDRIEELENKITELSTYYKNLNNDLTKCIQKVGVVRYSAFKDTGSDLSFALAMLDEKNNGVVLNGIYSREMSNIYAKPVENGKSSYTISEEEEEAIRKAINSEEVYKIR